ncbi:ATP synthase subunit I [Lentibacillus lipolyticus]|nr:ATP synthase subunit I [Lentibacillus lipolyticus]
MSYYENMVSRQRKWMFYLLAFFVLGAGFTPYQQIFLGLLLGGTVSLYNLWLLQRKIEAFAASVERNGSAVGLGSMSRLAAAVLAVLIALRFDAYVDVISVLAGLMTSYLVIVIDFFMSKSKK